MEGKGKIVSFVVYTGGGVLILLSLVSFHPRELPLLYSPSPPVSNLVGSFGNGLAFLIQLFLGWASYLLPLLLIKLALDRLRERKRTLRENLSQVSLILSISLLLSTFRLPLGEKSMFFRGEEFSGGLLGYLLFSLFSPFLGKVGTPLVGFLILFLSLVNILPLKKPSLTFLKRAPQVTPSGRVRKERRREKKRKKKREEIVPSVEMVGEEEEEEEAALPPLSLLKDPPPSDQEDDSFIQENARRLEEVLKEFGIQARVVDIHRGPVITSYELKPGSGVKVHQILNLSEDIALALKSPSVRIVTPIPGKAVIGVEIPNPHPRFVYIKEVISSPAYQDSPSLLTLALGKDIRGNPLVGNLKDMPHLLIAGTTGSGKTVCLHSLIMSILFKALPHQVKLVLIDPKMVELAPFASLPHLHIPIVTKSKEASQALQWIVEEMEERYNLLAGEGVREVDKFNLKMEREGREEDKLPYMVVIIDELADLMAVASRQVEDSIMRLAQLSRAAGIHLILATQRPSVDVITGVIKANFPCRISFRVSSKVDSRTILDSMGAEKLIGKGDMLYISPGGGKPIRAQAPLVSEEEIENVVGYLRRFGEARWESIPIFHEEKGEEESLPAEDDPLLKEAIKVVLTSGQASASHLQRRMRIGYARAGRLIDLMEKKGIVGPARGSKPREILVDLSYLDKIEREESSEKGSF